MVHSLSTTEVIEKWLKFSQKEDLESIMLALLQLEKQAKREKLHLPCTHLIGRWRLVFIGKKQSPNATIDRLKGSGKTLPSWFNIQLIYQGLDSHNEPQLDQGFIRNRVEIGGLVLELSGPWMYYSTSRIMAFDFLYLKIELLGRSLFSIPVRGGKNAEDQFWDQPLKEKAFFKYFEVTPHAIAARGKGGGIALWTKVDA